MSEDVYGQVKISGRGRFEIVLDEAKQAGFSFKAGLGRRKMIFADHETALRCHRWLFERGVRESLKVKHRLIRNHVIEVTADGELWL